MAQLIALYKTPKDAKAFDAYYFSTHAPLAKKIPGLQKYEVSEGGIGGPGGSAYHLVAMLTFNSAADIGTALGTPEGQATAGDLAKFADGGVELLIFDTKTL